MSDSWKTFGITIIVLIAVISLILIFSYLSRECNTNLDCSSNEYCAYNHKCIPIPERNSSSNLLLPYLILGISIIIAAFILNRRNKPNKSIPNKAS